LRDDRPLPIVRDAVIVRVVVRYDADDGVAVVLVAERVAPGKRDSKDCSWDPGLCLTRRAGMRTAVPSGVMRKGVEAWPEPARRRPEEDRMREAEPVPGR
jgi:hypothetical protein